MKDSIPASARPPAEAPPASKAPAGKTPRERSLRQCMSDLHIWAGLLLGWLLYAVFLTGSVSYFRDEISAWMRPDVPAQEAPADPVQVTGRMIGWLAERAPQAPQWGISLPSARSPGVNLFRLGDGPRRFMERRLDPRTGEPLSRRETLGGEFFYRFHFNLHYMSPITGRWIVGVAAMFMLVAIISGIITHKKIFAEFFTFRWGKGQRSWLDAHNGLAVLGLPFHLMITWSGLVTLMMLYMPWGALTAFPTRADQMRQQQVITGFRLPAPRSGHAAPLGDVPAMVAQARDRWGAQGVGRVYVNNPGEAQARVIVLRSIEGQVSVSPQYLVFDGTSGRLLEQHDTARPAAETRGGLIALHEGRFAHLQLRWLYFLLGLAGTGMVGSGLVLWTVKRRGKLPDPDRPYFGFRLVERLNIATIAGLPLAMTAFLWGNRLLPADAGQGSSGGAPPGRGHHPRTGPSGGGHRRACRGGDRGVLWRLGAGGAVCLPATGPTGLDRTAGRLCRAAGTDPRAERAHLHAGTAAQPAAGGLDLRDDGYGPAGTGPPDGQPGLANGPVPAEGQTGQKSAGGCPDNDPQGSCPRHHGRGRQKGRDR